MDIADVRRVNLRRYIERNFSGNVSRFAKRANRTPSYFNDLLAKPARKSFGEKIARALEIRFEMPRLSLDSEPPAEIVREERADYMEHQAAAGGDWPFSISRARFERLTDRQKLKIEGALEQMIIAFEGPAPVRAAGKKRKKAA